MTNNATELLNLTESEVKNLGGFAVTIEVLDWIVDNIDAGKRIVELGSGSTTEYLSRRYDVYSIEHCAEWCGTCQDSTYIHAPLLENKWYDPEIVFQAMPGWYDLLIIDGPPFKNIGRDCRNGILEHLDSFRHSIPWIIDDTNAKYVMPMSREISERTGRPIQYYSTGKHKKFGVLQPKKIEYSFEG